MGGKTASRSGFPLDTPRNVWRMPALSRACHRRAAWRRLQSPVAIAQARGIPAMLYPELFKQLEAVRWNMDRDIPWDKFDAAKLSEEQARTIKMNAITEWAALPATEMFLRDNRDDSDFSAFMSVWFFDEQEHSLVLMEYLRRVRPA